MRYHPCTPSAFLCPPLSRSPGFRDLLLPQELIVSRSLCVCVQFSYFLALSLSLLLALAVCVALALALSHFLCVALSQTHAHIHIHSCTHTYTHVHTHMCRRSPRPRAYYLKEYAAFSQDYSLLCLIGNTPLCVISLLSVMTLPCISSCSPVSRPSLLSFVPHCRRVHVM